MGSKESKQPKQESVLTWTEGKQSYELTVDDQKQWRWTTRGHLSVESLVTVKTTAFRLDSPFEGIVADMREAFHWKAYGSKPLHDAYMFPFELAAKPLLLPRAKSSWSQHCERFSMPEDQWIWFRSSHQTTLKDFIFAIHRDAFTEVTITPSQMTHMPFQRSFRLLNIVVRDKLHLHSFRRDVHFK